MENKFLQLLLPQLFEYDFDLNNNLTKLAVLTPNGSNVTNYDYGKDNQPATATFSNGKKLTYTYDTRNNLTKIEQGAGTDDSNLTYTTLEEYTYDKLSQLTQVDYRTSNKRVKYTYDNGGNIESEEIYKISGDTETLEEINTYTYYKSDSNSNDENDWGDLLTCYSNKKISNQKINNHEITYDEIGNPLEYRDGFKFNWSNGRQLDSYEKDGKTVNYTYDANGMRLTKTVDGVKHTYLYQDGLLVQETKGTDVFDYSYDANGRLTMLSYSSTDDEEDEEPIVYYYALNSRGDVIGLYNVLGNLIAKYTYDVWGNEVSITNGSGDEISNYINIATIQPFRYRSYYYDTDSGLYYLQSRYYDPVTHRFINADPKYVSTGTGIIGLNMFAYCDNNPINCIDLSGNACVCLTNRVRPGHVCNDPNREYVLSSSKSSHDLNRRPNSGEPGSTVVMPNGDRRTFGPDRKPSLDYDHDDHDKPNEHPHDEYGGHYHDWDWSLPKPRQGPRLIDFEDVLGEGLTLTSILVMIATCFVVCV